jgi:hypothetical protein
LLVARSQPTLWNEYLIGSKIKNNMLGSKSHNHLDGTGWCRFTAL